MITNKGAPDQSSLQPSPSPECCMCGDFGLSYELFQCTVCQFRSQHRYCSNLYPKAESYEVCNWCLSNNEENKEKSNNSSNLSSSNKTNSEEDNKIDGSKKKKKKKKGYTHDSDIDQGLRRSSSGGNLKSQVKVNNNSSPIKKQATTNKSSPERSPSIRRRIITRGRLEEKLRRTRSEDIPNKNSNGIINKLVFRNKVRRYKLLDEVSC